MIITLQNTNIHNSSLQVGDRIYYANIQDVGDLPSNTGQPMLHGVVTAIGSSTITTDSQNNIPSGAFLMFLKNDQVNNVGLKGYYAEVEMRNNSKQGAELFALSSEVVESSK
tara:strand:- start:281 stop:616 length:336 start_codon:yes stop_codon:yes gene_type:complete